MRARRLTVLATTGAITLAACGSSSTDVTSASVGTLAPTAVEPATTQTTETTAAAPSVPVSEPTSEATAAPQPTPSATAAPEPPPEPAMLWPDESCSADNSPTPTESAAAPAPVLEVRAESAASPLPDLAVRRINCGGGWVNLKNELPSDRALLIWMWAPH